MPKFFKVAIAAATILLSAVMVSAQETPAYLDRANSPEVRAADLLGRLTLEQKSWMMVFESRAIEELGIPQYTWWNEALHGVARNGLATVYPMPISMAASFDDELVEQIFTEVSDEARIKNRLTNAEGNFNIYTGVTFWTPNINIFRDPRWGRGIETYGEDPYLTAKLGAAVVRGLQGDPDAEVLKAHACAKHFCVHSGPESTRHCLDAQASDRDLFETYLPAFKSLVQDADVQEVMFAYNSFRGFPCGANTYILQDILRNEWGYKGLIVSDCWAVNDFYEPWGHHFSADPVEATAATMKAGINIECGQVLLNIPAAVERGLIDEDLVDENLLPVLVARFRLGEFDGVSPYDALPDEDLACEEHRLDALKMARETMTLLKNDGTLPLPADAKVALVGPNAADSVMMWGNYNGYPRRTVTLLDALKERIPDLVYDKGCDLVLDEPTRHRTDALLDQLEGCDYVIFAGGISPRLEGEEMPVYVPGFYGGDRTTLDMPDCQRFVIERLAEAGKKVILVNFSGSAISLVPEEENCCAILQAWYPGQEGGTAICEALYGEINPSGKLPVTVYKSVEDLPDFEDYSMANRTYKYFKGEPEFVFGYGLSYTTFEYSKIKVRCGRVIAKVRNTGDRDGTEVVQLYVRNRDDAEGPIKSLRGYKRVAIKAGKSARVVFKLVPETFDSWSEETGRVQPLTGNYTLMVGGSSADKDLLTIDYKCRKL